MQNNNIIYAPIIIPTLNRFVHLERCIKSLANNLWAKYTEIFISVDYPPSEKYKEGYLKVVEYLKNTNDLNQFKDFHIFYQKTNLGATGNCRFLKEQIKNYECYIFSEDDNEFSKNFIEYIDKGLLRYNSNDKIIGVNAIKDANWIIRNNNNVIASKLFPCYGFGGWFDKDLRIKENISNVLLNPINWKISNIYKLYKRNSYLFSIYVNGVITTNEGIFYDNEKLKMNDSTRSIYMYLTDSFCVVPVLSKSRNWGNDGSGINMPSNKNIDPIIRWKFDESDRFDYHDDDLCYDIRNDKIAERFLISTLGHKSIIKAKFVYLIFFMLGLNRNKIITIRKMFSHKK